MNEKELNEFKEILRKQLQEVTSSKEAARKLLTELGMLTPTGRLSKSFKQALNVSR